MAALFELWGADYVPARGPACDQASSQQLRCLTLQKSSIGELRSLNRPVDLELIANNGERYRVLLTGLDDTHASVLIAGVRERISIADLTHYSYGEHLMLFRPAINDSAGSLFEGARGPSVIWLRTTLQAVAKVDLSGNEPDLFDAALTNAIRDYQRDRGLFVDGIVGDRTLINLQTDVGLIGVSLKSGMH
jgi:general secretion pathway protein A